MQNRRELFQERLLSRALSTARIDAGLEVVFPADADLVAEIRAIIDLERQCCGFLDFDLGEESESSRVLLTITGPAEARPVLARFEAAFTGGDVEQSVPDRMSNALLKRTGQLGVAAGVACLLACELPVLLTVIGLTGIAASLSFLQPSVAIEAGASVLIVAGSTMYVVWRRRSGHTRTSGPVSR